MRKQFYRLMPVGIVSFAISLFAAGIMYAGEEEEVLAKAVVLSQFSLYDCVARVSKGAAIAISAKFEMDEAGKLSLSIYSADGGLAKDSEKNTYSEISGDPTVKSLKTESAAITDPGDLKAAKEQLKVLSASKLSLLGLIGRAQKEQPGILISATPALENQKPCCVFMILAKGKTVKVVYDVVTGKKIP